MREPPMQWSKAIEELYREQVHCKVEHDKRTDWEEGRNISLGYPFKVIIEEVLEKGRADFSEGYEHDDYGALTEEDKVLLYCFACMKRHFYEALATFRAYKPTLKRLFDSEARTVLADLGCGPGTAGLALSDCLNKPRIVYAGLDIAPAMRTKAKSMLIAAKERSLLDPRSEIAVKSSWKRLVKMPEELEKRINVLFNATYLFSSASLDVDDVVQAVLAMKESRHVKKILFVYSNTITDISGEKFNAFKKQLKNEFSTDGCKNCKRQYRRWRSNNTIVEADFVRQLLNF